MHSLLPFFFRSSSYLKRGEGRAPRSTLALSWFHLLLRILLLHLSPSLPPSLPLAAFLPSVLLSFPLRVALTTLKGASAFVRQPPPSPTLFFAFADVFSRSEEKKSPQKTSIFLPSFNFAINEIPHEEHLLPESLNFEFSASLPPTKINVIF